MTDDRWKEEFDEEFGMREMREFVKHGTYTEEVKMFISRLLSRKDQERRAEIEGIVTMIEDYYDEAPVVELVERIRKTYEK